MKYSNESIFFSTIRTFFHSIFGIFGFFLGLSLLFIVLSLPFSGKSTIKALPHKAEILPDAKGSRKKLGKDAPVILQVSIENVIGMEEMTPEKIEKILLDSQEDELKDGRVKGILLYVDSPGGGVFESNHIYQLIKQYKERYKIPVHAYVQGLCASGGYYISCAADHISASEVSLIGSVGVLSSPFLNVREGIKKIGVEALVLSAGEDKATLNPFEEWSKEEISYRQKLLDFFYENFLEVVTSNRPQLPKEKLVKEYGARVFPAAVAKEYGYIDEANATRDQALSYLVHKAGIDEKTEYQVITLSKAPWWKQALDKSIASPLLTGKVKHEWVPETNSQQQFQYRYAP